MKIFLIAVAGVILFSCNGNGNQQTQQAPAAGVDGEQLFKINCSQCHAPNRELIGPALKNVADRWKDKTLLYEFIKNSPDVISRDAYAKALFEKYNRSPMLPMPNLTNADIDAILKYCNEVQ